MKVQNDYSNFGNYQEHQMYWKEVIQNTLTDYSKGILSKEQVKVFLTVVVEKAGLLIPFWYDAEYDRMIELSPDVFEQSKKLAIEAINEMDDESRFSAIGSNSILWNLIQIEAIY